MHRPKGILEVKPSNVNLLVPSPSVLQAGLEDEGMLNASFKREEPLLSMTDDFHIYGPGRNSLRYVGSINFIDGIL